MNRKVLFVDDDANILSAYKRQLRKQFELTTATSGAEGLALLRDKGPFAVIVSDMQMPEMNGLQFLFAATKAAPDTARIMLTGNADQRTAMDAVNQGRILRFQTKPCPPESLAAAIEDGLTHYRLVTAERELLERTLAGSVKVLVDVLSLAEPEAFGRMTRLRGWMQAIAKQLALPNAWELNLAVMLSPIGQLTVPAEIRKKQASGAALTAEEREIIASSPEATRNLIGNIPRLEAVSRSVLYQGKGFDGSGFPRDGVAGEEIPIGARILRLLNDLDPLVEGKVPNRAAIAKVEAQAALYDPQVLEAVKTCFVSASEQEAEEVMVPVPVARLRAGDRIAEDIVAQSGNLVLAAGHEVSQVQVEKLRNLHKAVGLKEPLLVFRPAAEAEKALAAAS